CLLMPVVRGYGRSLAEISEALVAIVDGLEKRKCDVLSIVINRVAADLVEDIPVRLKNIAPKDVPVYALADNRILWNPTVYEIAKALKATFLNGEEDCSLREVADYKVAAMELSNFLGYIKEGTLVITPGDRPDILLGSLLADASSTYPRLAGIILTCGVKPAPKIQQLVEGFKTSLPILAVDTDTFTVAIQVSEMGGMLDPANKRKMEMALGIFESG